MALASAQKRTMPISRAELAARLISPKVLVSRFYGVLHMPHSPLKFTFAHFSRNEIPISA
jgi:hypothetical protein